MLRIGQGFDVHRLVEGRRLVLCGVNVPYERGLLGHSDADVALHALMDALLGAAALGDIGKHFPDDAPAYCDADSLLLLKRLLGSTVLANARIHNVDLTIIAQSPKLAPYIEAMRSRIAEALRIGIGQVSVKATTTERLGFTGTGEGIAAQAVAMIDL